MSTDELTIEQALETFLCGIVTVTGLEQVPLLRSVGRILAEDIKAPFSVPSFPKSAMDGYAVRSSEVTGASGEQPVELSVIGERLAGDHSSLPEAIPFSAMRIMTGAEVPPEYDAVVREEDTDYGEEKVRIFKGVAYHQNYCAVGEDICKGDVVIPAGTRLGRVQIGTLASLGIDRVFVRRKLKIRILSTGSELMDVKGAAEPPAGKIYNSIAYMLEASLLRAGFEADHLICQDDAGIIEAAIRDAVKEGDVVITTGGVSVGKKDLLPEILELIGADIRFRRAKIQPGTPTIGSSFQGTPILSLSGNPYAALANFDYYFWPLAAKLTGCEMFLPEVEEAVLVSRYDKVNSSRRLLRAYEEQGKVSLPVKSHASAVISNLMACNCYLDLAEGQRIQPGDRVIIRKMPF